MKNLVMPYAKADHSSKPRFFKGDCITITIIAVALITTILSYIWQLRISLHGYDLSEKFLIGRVVVYLRDGEINGSISFLRFATPSSFQAAGDSYRLTTGKWIAINPELYPPGHDWPIHFYFDVASRSPPLRDVFEPNILMPIWALGIVSCVAWWLIPPFILRYLHRFSWKRFIPKQNSKNE